MLSTAAGPRADLNLVVAGHAQSLSMFVANRVYPIVPVDVEVGTFFKIQPGTLLRAPNANRAPGTKYARDNFEMADDTYQTTGKGLEGLIAEERIRRWGNVLSLEQEVSMQKVNQILRSEEVALAGTLFNRSTFGIAPTTGHDPTNEWDDHTNAVPVDDVLIAVEALHNNLGDFRSMGLSVCALMSWRTARHAKLCTQVRAGLGGIYTDPAFRAADIPDQLLAEALGVDEVIVPDSRYQTAGTTAAPTASKIWSDEYCLVFVRANPSAALMMGLGVTFVWNQYGGEYEVSTYDADDHSAVVVQVDRNSQHKTVQSTAGYLIGNLITT